MVLAGWAWVYLRNKSCAGLITGDVEPLVEPGESRHDKHRMLSSEVDPIFEIAIGAILRWEILPGFTSHCASSAELRSRQRFFPAPSW